MRTVSHRRRAGLKAALAGGLGALLIGAPSLACGGGDEPRPETGERLVPPGAIETGDFYFAPRSRRVPAGETVTWFNAGEQLHNVRGPGFSSEAFGGGGSYRFRFKRPGTYAYLCTLHPTRMRGTVIVE